MPRPDTDWLLVAMLDGVSLERDRFRLTVFSGGLAVIGTAVAEEEFMQRIGLAAAVDDVVRQRDEDHSEISRIKTALTRDDLSADEREALLSKGDDLQRKFIDLVDVTILGAGPAPIAAPAWRGRLSQISGWIPGAPGESP